MKLITYFSLKLKSLFYETNYQKLIKNVLEWCKGHR